MFVFSCHFLHQREEFAPSLDAQTNNNATPEDSEQAEHSDDDIWTDSEMEEEDVAIDVEEEDGGSDDGDDDVVVDDEHDDDGVYEMLRKRYVIPKGGKSSKRAKRQWYLRNSAFRKLLQAYAQTELCSAVITVNDRDRIVTHSTNGNFFSFCRTVAHGILMQEHATVKVPLVELIHRFNDNNLAWSFDKIRSLAQDLSIDQQLINNAEIRFQMEVHSGRLDAAIDTIRSTISSSLQSLCSEFQDVPPRSPAPQFSGPSNEDTDTSKLVNTFQVSTTPVISWLDIAKQVKASSFDTFSSFVDEWNRLLVDYEHSSTYMQDILTQDITDPVSKLSIKNPTWIKLRNGRITGSIVGNLLGEGYTSKEHAIQALIHGATNNTNFFVRRLMMWGTYNEDNARAVCLLQLQELYPDGVKIETKGI
jgi:hypothetical protein